MGRELMKMSSRVHRTLCFVATSVLLLAACGSSDDDAGGEPAELTNQAPDDAGSDTATETTTADTAPPETAAPESADPVVRVSGGTTDPWEIAGNCVWTPDNTGAASSLYIVEDIDEDREEEITILEAWPFQLEEDSVSLVIGSIVEPGGNLLTVLDVEASSDGETITLLADVHNGIKTFDDPPDFTLTVTCGP